MKSTVLSVTILALGKYGPRSPSRPGYKDQNGQTFLPPKSAKRAAHWVQVMKNRGVKFEG